MITLKEDTTLVGIAELRNKASEVMEKIKKCRVILTKRNKPLGVIIDYEEYEHMQEMLEEVEDFVLGTIAGERLKRKGKKTVTLDEAEKKVGLR
ncbi:MAG: type II toxin-antitoxin system Phd/YefM family antitoxin [Thermodesulfobacteriota bacterium]|nr:type II toxin-antitoxin system Phd/YefM family antitoxin [Thermodesulfobacteriota bacterium]